MHLAGIHLLSVENCYKACSILSTDSPKLSALRLAAVVLDTCAVSLVPSA